MQTKTVRPLPLDTMSTLEVDYTSPFNLVQMDFEDGSQYLSSGPQLVLENGVPSSDLISASRGWTTVNLVATGITAPSSANDLHLPMTKLMGTSTNGDHYAEMPLPGYDDDQIVSCAVYARRSNYDYARLLLMAKDGASTVLQYRFSTKTMTVSGNLTGDTLFHTVEELSGTTVRLIILGANLRSGINTPVVRAVVQSAASNAPYAGNGGNGTFYGGAQVWREADMIPRVATDGEAYPRRVYIEGLVAVGEFIWGPDGDQTGDIELFNENNAAIGLVLSNGVAEVPCTVSTVYVKADGSFTVPVVLAAGVMTDSDITPSSALVSMTTVKAGVEFHPSRYVTSANGFNWLPPDGAQVVWGQETYIFEREGTATVVPVVPPRRR